MALQKKITKQAAAEDVPRGSERPPSDSAVASRVKAKVLEELFQDEQSASHHRELVASYPPRKHRLAFAHKSTVTTVI